MTLTERLLGTGVGIRLETACVFRNTEGRRTPLDSGDLSFANSQRCLDVGSIGEKRYGRSGLMLSRQTMMPATSPATPRATA
jgi:hypothetical protein